MTRTEHLLTMLAEECAEVAQRASKAIRFGLTEVQPGQDLTNAERIRLEMVDLLTVYMLLHNEGSVPNIGFLSAGGAEMIRAKKAKVEKFLRYSAECGTYTETPRFDQ